MTTAATKKLRFDLAGFKDCKGDQFFYHEGVQMNGSMGFQQSQSKKSRARNDMENALRLQHATPAVCV